MGAGRRVNGRSPARHSSGCGGADGAGQVAGATHGRRNGEHEGRRGVAERVEDDNAQRQLRAAPGAAVLRDSEAGEHGAARGRGEIRRERLQGQMRALGVASAGATGRARADVRVATVTAH